MLANVYAIEVKPGLFMPRTKVRLTDSFPKLWAKRKDAERALEEVRKGVYLKWSYGRPAWMEEHQYGAKIVRFRLVEVDPAHD